MTTSRKMVYCSTDLMKTEYVGRTAKFTKNGQVYYALYNDQGIRKGVHGDKKSSPKGYKAKINIGADGNYIELAENSIYQGTSVEQGKNNRFHSNAKTWDYYVKTIQSDGKYFDVLINVKDTGNSQYVYDITLKEADSLPDASSASYAGSSPASTSSIPKTQKNATIKYLQAAEKGNLDVAKKIVEEATKELDNLSQNGVLFNLRSIFEFTYFSP